MRSTSARLILFALILCAQACTSGSAQNSKPVRENPLITEFVSPPPTLNEMVLKADAVILGRITGARPYDKHIPGLAHPRVKTLWTFRVGEVLHFKGSHEGLAEIYIEREGGERDRGKHIVRELQPEFPPFELGQQYVLFLERAGDLWWPAYGPDSAFRLSPTGVIPMGASPPNRDGSVGRIR